MVFQDLSIYQVPHLQAAIAVFLYNDPKSRQNFGHQTLWRDLHIFGMRATYANHEGRSSVDTYFPYT